MLTWSHPTPATSRTPAFTTTRHPVLNKRLVFVGDVNGDKNELVRSLKIAQVLDIDGDWVAEETVLIQMGNLLANGNNKTDTAANFEIIRYIEKLQEDALEYDSNAIVLLGSTELQIYEKLGRRGPSDIIRFIESLPVTVKLNDMIFAHSG
jgi:Icc-related predicted phosphoesterase